MKILVVSHNVFSKTSNMGKTLASYFRGIDNVELAQFYVHSEIPTDDVCTNYYRVTDKEAIKSIFTRKSGTVLTRSNVNVNAADSRTDTGKTAALYQKARKRTPLIYLARNTWWKLGAWNTKKLRNWVDEFDPDVVFFAAGDYAFTYKISLSIAKRKKIPLALCCMDDYFFHNKNSGSLLGRWVHKRFMKQVKKAATCASFFFTICDKMNRDYTKLFNKPCYTLHTSTSLAEPLKRGEGNAISYIGNLSFNRHEQLITLGRALKALNLEGKPDHIDVYSTETREFILKDMTEENGICFHGAVDAQGVLDVMRNSLAVIHTESFVPDTKQRVAYSVSTKIADSLASGTCLLAYGPAEVASMAYLIENNAALCITENDSIQEKLTALFNQKSMRDEIISNALALAKKNHSTSKNSTIIQSVFEDIIRP